MAKRKYRTTEAKIEKLQKMGRGRGRGHGAQYTPQITLHDLSPHGPVSRLCISTTIDKLEIERRYWTKRGISWRLVTDRQVNRVRTFNLLLLHEARWLDYLDMPHATHWRDRCTALLLSLLPVLSGPHDLSVREFASNLEAARGWEPGAARFAMRHMAANCVLQIDLDVPFDAGASIQQMQPAHDLPRSGQH